MKHGKMPLPTGMPRYGRHVHDVHDVHGPASPSGTQATYLYVQPARQTHGRVGDGVTGGGMEGWRDGRVEKGG